MENKFNIEKEIEKMEQILENIIKENCKEKTQEELTDKICKLTKENINLKAQNQALTMQFFLKGDDNQWN